MVRPRHPKFAVEENKGCLQNMAVGNHPAADPSRTGNTLLSGIYQKISDRQQAGISTVERSTETVGRTGLLLARQKPAQRRTPDCR